MDSNCQICQEGCNNSKIYQEQIEIPTWATNEDIVHKHYKSTYYHYNSDWLNGIHSYKLTIQIYE